MTDHLARTAITAWSSMINGDSLVAMPRVTNPLWRTVASNGQEFVLKLLPEYPPGASPVEAYRVLTHLVAEGIPLALPVLTDNAMIHTEVDQRLFTLLPLVAADPGNHDLAPTAAATALAVGQAIGKLDQALATASWPPHSFNDDPVQILDGGFADFPDETVQRIEPHVEMLRATCSNLPTQLTHGDCNDGNVLVHGSRVSGFLDFDHLPMGPRVRDLSYYLVSRLHAHLEQDEGAEQAAMAMLAVFDRYVAGYHQAYPLSGRELSAVVPLMLLIEIGGARWSLHGWEPDPERYQDSVRTINWITAHFSELLHASAPVR